MHNQVHRGVGGGVWTCHPGGCGAGRATPVLYRQFNYSEDKRCPWLLRLLTVLSLAFTACVCLTAPSLPDAIDLLLVVSILAAFLISHTLKASKRYAEWCRDFQ